MKKFFTNKENAIVRQRPVKRYVDITGLKYNRLTAVEYSHTAGVSRSAYWVFLCDCGNYTTTTAHSVKHSLTKSCGCLNVESRLKMVSSMEVRLKMSSSHKGEKSRFWRGGVTEKNRAIRTSLEYRDWRKKVFERDNYTCQICLQRGLKLNADHIKPFALFPELRLELSNGRTLCFDCHKKTDTYGHRSSPMYGKLLQVI